MDRGDEEHCRLRARGGVLDQNHGIGSALTAQLLADARASSITKITALVGRDNSAAIHVLRSVATVRSESYEGSDRFIEAAVAACLFAAPPVDEATATK